jgi:hypothetical protein
MNYIPPFYNRLNEYGNKHIYFEALLHAYQWQFTEDNNNPNNNNCNLQILKGYTTHRYVHSAVHCGVTLNGRKNLILKFQSKQHTQTLSSNICYITCPAAITHAILPEPLNIK